MAKRKLSRVNQAHANAAAYHLNQMGADHTGGSSFYKADSLGDQIQAVAMAVNAMSGMGDGYCCIEDVYDTYVIIEMCMPGQPETYWQADYSTADNGAVTLAARDSWQQVEEVWQPVQASAKAGLPIADAQVEVTATMKAAGERIIDVCIAYGSAKSKDSHGEYFSPNTDLAESDFPSPPLIYYHGFDQGTNREMSKPIVIGKPMKRWNSELGHNIRYQLKSNRYADKTWQDAQEGPVPASPGTVGYLIRKDNKTGELLYWPIAEVSAWDRAGGRKQAYRHTVATASLKAIYLSEGLTIPETLNAEPEALGDSAAHASADIDDSKVGEALARALARAQLAQRGITLP